MVLLDTMTDEIQPAKAISLLAARRRRTHLIKAVSSNQTISLGTRRR
jgi:hypothetical protein